MRKYNIYKKETDDEGKIKSEEIIKACGFWYTLFLFIINFFTSNNIVIKRNN